MKIYPLMRSMFYAISVSIFVLASGMFFSTTLLHGKAEKKTIPAEIILATDMTIAEFAEKNYLNDEIIVKVFYSMPRSSILSATGKSTDEIITAVKKARAIELEHGSKNWIKIALKFALWAVFLSGIFYLMFRRKMTPRRRKIGYFFAFMIFGAILGSDPSPMGTVKDAIVLLGKDHVIFPPRLIAFSIMLIFGTILVNKILCGWGCQLGTLQDFIFRIGRDTKDNTSIIRQFKVPFVVTNTIRVVFFISITAAAFIASFDIVSIVDPFKLFSPLSLSITAGIFIAGILILSLFTYRPWCHFFCPFGLVGWLGEKVSIYRIRVNRDSCISCGACVKACPSHAMNGIWNSTRCGADCFLCGVCIECCPTKLISVARISNGK